MFKDVEHGRAAYDGALGTKYAELLKTKDINSVAWMENGLRHVTSNRPVCRVADMPGLKLRVMPSKVAIECFRSLGAKARQLPYNQLYEALRTGQFEAQENPVASIESIELYEVQKNLCLTGHIYSVGVLIASPDVMEVLNPAQKAALRRCGMRRRRIRADPCQLSGVPRL